MKGVPFCVEDTMYMKVGPFWLKVLYTPKRVRRVWTLAEHPIQTFVGYPHPPGV